VKTRCRSWCSLFIASIDSRGHLYCSRIRRQLAMQNFSLAIYAELAGHVAEAQSS
jgi:hypothetical protein